MARASLRDDAFTKFWFPDTAAKLSSGKVLLSRSRRGCGDGNHWIEPGTAPDSMSAMARCERGHPNAGNLTTFKCDRGSWTRKAGALTYTTVSATLPGLPPVLNVDGNSNAPSFNGKALQTSSPTATLSMGRMRW